MKKTARPPGFYVVPLGFHAASAFIARKERYLCAPQTMTFCLGVAQDLPDGPALLGVAIVGPPTMHALDDGMTLEVTRVATESPEIAHSLLYAAAWQAAQALGYRRLVAHTLATGAGSSPRARGWRVLAQRPPRGGWRPALLRHHRRSARAARAGGTGLENVGEPTGAGSELHLAPRRNRGGRPPARTR